MALNYGVPVSKFLIWGGISWNMRSQILFDVSAAIKYDFQPYIRRYTIPNENIVIPIFMYFLTISRNVSATSDK